METQIKEENILIARRSPPGDNWYLEEKGPNSKIYNSLTDALEAWFQIHQEQVEFRLAPFDSKLYAIRKTEEEVIPEVQEYGIYGEIRFKQGI